MLNGIYGNYSVKNNEMDKCKISDWEVVLSAPDRVITHCLMHDTRLCQLVDKMTNNKHCTKIYRYKTYVKTGYITYVS